MTDAVVAIHEEEMLEKTVMGYVQQAIFLFAGDIATNVRRANPLDEAAVVSAARQWGADPTLPHGEVVERGTHGALVRKGGVYERLRRLQLGEGAVGASSAGNRLPPVGAVR